MSVSSTKDESQRPVDWPELRACKSVRASIFRQLLRERNTLESRLQALDCPPAARALLNEWLDGVALELPDPGELAESLFEPELESWEFETAWETLESSHGVLRRMPKPASEYLHAIARQDNGEALALFYWAHLHHPLSDQLDLLGRAVADLVLCSRLTRRVHEALRRRDSEAGSRPAAARARAAIPADLQAAHDEENRSPASLAATADPIAGLLSDVQVQAASSGGLSGQRGEPERRAAARSYAIRYAQDHLRLPVGRHAVSRHGQPGDDFWVDFGEAEVGNSPSRPG